MAVLGHRKEMMWRLGRADRVERDSDVAIGAVFESNRARQTRGELPVNLTLCRARANGAPGDEIRNILGCNHVEELGARRHAVLVKLEQQVTGDLQSFINVKTPVKFGVVKQSLPSHRGARFFKIDAHNYQQVRD